MDSNRGRVDKEDILTLVELLASLEYISGEISSKVPQFIQQFENRVQQIESMQEKLNALTLAIDDKIREVTKEQKGIVYAPDKKIDLLIKKINLIENQINLMSSGKRKSNSASIIVNKIEELYKKIDDIDNRFGEINNDRKFYVPKNNVPIDTPQNEDGNSKPSFKIKGLLSPIFLVGVVAGTVIGGSLAISIVFILG